VLNESESLDAIGTGSVSDGLLFRWLAGDVTPAVHRALRTWEERSSTHRERVDELRRLLAVVPLRAAAPVFREPPAARSLLARRWRRRKGDLRHRSMAALAAAAAVLMLSTAAGRILLRPNAPPESALPGAFGLEEFVTESTEPATVGLRDGSVVRLAPGSRLRVLQPDNARRVELTGRAYFAVSSDSTNPFTVHGQAGTATALGTRFDLEVSPNALRLIVIEGRVALSAGATRTIVEAGQMARAIQGTGLPAVEVSEIAPLVDWVGDFVAFQNTPLGQAAREIARRHGVEIRFEEPELATRTISTWFAGRSVQDMMEVIGIITNTRFSQRGGTITIHAVR
jgi:transmembrane sensor